MSPEKPGIVLVFLNPRPDISGFETWRKEAFLGIPGVKEIQILSATDAVEDNKPYRYQNAFLVENIQVFDEKLVGDLTSSASKYILNSDWHIYGTVSFNARENLEGPVPGTVVVSVGMAPIDTEEVITDYHKWYTDEHLPLLAEVPGWRTGSRYSLDHVLGSKLEYAAPFLAIHQYDEENGLGGPVWKKSFTPWTEKVVKAVSAPHHRRVWRYDV